MGCCYSGEEEAKETTLALPAMGEPITVKLKKQGMFDADYDVLDVKNGPPGEQWMLIDTVGGLFTSGLKYYLKHRMAGEEKSTVIGAAEIHGSNTEFKAKITDVDVDMDLEFDSDPEDFSDDGDSDNEFMMELEVERKIKAKWKLEKQCELFSDYEMQNRLGKVKVKAKGKYKRKEKRVTQWITETDAEGNERRREVSKLEIKHKTKVKKFFYKMDVMGTKIDLTVEKNAAGGSFWRAGLEWRGRSETGAELFHIIGDGRNCTVRTGVGSDPSSTLLAAFAVACKFDPAEVQQNAENLCATRI